MEKRATEGEMVGWHHRLSWHEFEQTPGDGNGQGSLVCCSLCGGKELYTTEGLNNNDWFTLKNPSVAMIPNILCGPQSSSRCDNNIQHA